MGERSDRSTPKHDIDELVREVIPFRFLAPAGRIALAHSLKKRTIPAGDTVYELGDLDSDIYLLAGGVVETLDTRHDPAIRLNRIEPGHYFGERATLFEIPREYTLRAVEDSVVYALSGDEFLELIHSSRSFAQAFGAILREKQRIFDAFDQFIAELMRGIGNGSIDIRRLLPLYRILEPALHPGANVPEIDFPALKYAVSRLPKNVTRNFIYLLTDDLLFEFSMPDATFVSIPTSARRRNVWEMLPGKSMVLLRDGLSDLIDFVTCLCLYAVEAVKIRKRIADPSLFLNLGRSKSLATLPFTDAERTGLRHVWGKATTVRLEELTRHREAIYIDIRRQTQAYSSRRTDLWTKNISAATRKLLGCDPGELPEDTSVHVISSNTHSVTNCLNPFFVEHANEIVDWAKETDHPAAQVSLKNDMDAVYAVSREYLASHGELLRNELGGSKWGMAKLTETVSTGIEVQLIDLSRLAGARLDPELGSIPAYNSLLVNIDYAFGEQAEDIIRNLIMLFGNRLSSINVLGKAGAFVGRRGDVLVPTAFIEQNSDRFYPFGDTVNCDLSDLRGRTEDREVHIGPLLTVSGTLLQNSTMLRFYRHIWDCIGLEMEGTSYYRQILESQQLEVIDRAIPLRFLYYVSDLPLDRSADLSASLSPAEGIPPLYAITRQILIEIFGQENRRKGLSA